MIKYILGIIAGFSLYGIYQDVLGKDRYIEWCANNWLPPSKTVPIHISVLIITLLVVVTLKGIK